MIRLLQHSKRSVACKNEAVRNYNNFVILSSPSLSLYYLFYSQLGLNKINLYILISECKYEVKSLRIDFLME